MIHFSPRLIKATLVVFLKCLNMVILNTGNETEINYESEVLVLVSKP